MADRVNIGHDARRYIKLMQRVGEATAEEKSFMMKQNESDLMTALQMPMFKNLPTSGFKYDWEQFRIRDGLFLISPRSHPQDYQIINNHVEHFSPEEMDVFCAEIFDRAPDPRAEYDKNWATVPQELGIQIRADSTANCVFWDWGMKLMAARIVWNQETGAKKLRGLTAPDTPGDINMFGQPNENVPDPKPLSLAAQAIDSFIARGDLTWTDLPNRGCSFGSHQSVGGPTSTWWGFNFRCKSPKRISRPRRVLSEHQNHAVTAQGSSSQAGSVDDLVIGMHSTTMEDGRAAPRVFTNLAIRTVNPMKRRQDDTEESGAATSGDEPLAKMAKASQGQGNTSGSPSQLDEP